MGLRLTIRWHSIAIISLIAGFARLADAQTPFTISPHMEGPSLGSHFLTYEDPSETLSLDEIITLDRQGELTPSTQAVPNYGLNPAAQWVKFKLHNPGSQTREIYLENKFPLTDRFSLYWHDEEGDWQEKTAGDQVSFATRDIETRQAVFRFHLTPGTHTFYARSDTVGAMQLPLHVWSPDTFHAHNAIEYSYLGLLIGFHVVICLYNLFLFWSLRDITYLSYVSYVFSNLLYQYWSLGLAQQSFHELGVAETIYNETMIITVDLVCITSLLFSRQFLNLGSRLPRLNKIYNAALVMSVVNIGITLFMSVEIGTMICLYTASQATTLLILAGVMVTMSGYPPAKYYLAAWGCYLLGVTGTLMNLLGFAPSSDFTRWGQFTGGAFEVAILSLALGARINEKRRQHVRQINELNQNLEKKVEERTAKIQSLLKHIPQGILSINRRGVLEENYSSQLTEILGREDIAYKPFKDLVLDRSDLSDDDKDQAYQTLTNTLGENYINFEANKDKLPKQINLICEDKTKTLRLTWNIEIDQDEEADHILVTLLDVSSEVAAQTELQRKNKEFELLQQLVEVNSNHSLQFFKSCDPLLDENRRLIEAGDLTLDTLKILFVNTHTIKGAARSLQLKALANELHKVESYYSQAVKEEQPINPDKIKEEFQQAELCYESYRAVNRDLLGRADDQSTIAIDRGFLHDNIKLLDNLVDVNEIPGDLQSIIHKNLNELTKKIFSNLQNIIENALSQANKIAGDLGKEPPHLYYDIDEIWVNHQQEEVIKNAFVHIVRNALDHGIEGGEQRRKKGKSPRGTINIKAFQRNHWIVINVEDDGSGLDLQKVREKSAALGLTREHTSAKDTAALIFEPGFSTADKISLLSGRGVGMGAVKQYIESIGGTVRIDSLQPIDEGQRYYQFKIAIRLPTEPGSSISKAS